MNQKPSVVQIIKSVPQVLTSDNTPAELCFSRLQRTATKSRLVDLGTERGEGLLRALIH